MIIGHKRQFDYLKKVHERGTFAHAYLFFGPEHVGKLHVAREWAKLFFPPTIRGLTQTITQINADIEIRVNPRHYPRESANEQQLIDENRHPDFFCFSKEKLLASDNQKEIGIKDVLELRRLAFLSSNSGGHKFMVIDGADDMSEEAQNSLLKILEEPPQKTIFILITDSSQGLLPTVLSRTVPIEFFFASDEELASFIEGSTKNTAQREKILAISSGRPGIAVLALADEDYLEKEWSAYESFKKVFNSDTLDQFLYSQEIYQETGTIEKLIYFFLSELRKKMSAEENAEQALNSLKRIFNGLELIKKTNVNKRLLLDNIFLETCDK